MTAPVKKTPKEIKEARAAAAAKRRMFTPAQWAEFEALYAAGSVTYADLAVKHGGSIATFERHMKKNGIVKGSAVAAAKAKLAEKLETASIDEATVLAARIRETKEQHYTMASNLTKLTWNEILQAKKDGNPVSIAYNNLKALQLATAILKTTREEKWAVLGLDRPDAVDPAELPELVISELTAEQIKELRDRDHSELDDISPAAVVDPDDDDVEDDDAVVEEA